LVESVLFSPVYTATEKDLTQIVIDGQQRLVSLFSFIDGQFPNDQKEFKLIVYTWLEIGWSA
jgi:uncharacterized protein with ParB-like and HNH nuclease domain